MMPQGYATRIYHSMDHPAWQIFLQHRSISSNQQVLLLLFSTSQAARVTVMTHCAGMLPVRCQLRSLQTAEQFSFWIKHHYSLAKSVYLHIDRFKKATERDTAVGDIGAALQQSLADAANTSTQLQAAAAATAMRSAQLASQATTAGSVQANQLRALAATAAVQAKQLQAAVAAILQARTLRLQEFKLTTDESNRPVPLSTVVMFLQQLPAACLTRLELQSTSGNKASKTSFKADAAAAPSLQQSLAALTNLRSLSLQHYHAHSSMPALASLKRLTGLQMCKSDVLDSSLQYLPCSLAMLQVQDLVRKNEYPFRNAPLSIQHCTALTHLSIDAVIKSGDRLPPNVSIVQVTDCESVQPFLQLKKLQELEISAVSSTGSQVLVGLNSSTVLGRLRVGYKGGSYSLDVDYVPLAFAAWTRVRALCELTLQQDVEEVAVRHFSTLTAVTKLVLDFVEWQGETPAQQMQLCARAIQQFNHLQELVFNWQYFEWSTKDAKSLECAESNRNLAKAIASLASLRALRVDNSYLLAGCLPYLIAPQLTGLTIIIIHTTQP